MTTFRGTRETRTSLLLYSKRNLSRSKKSQFHFAFKVPRFYSYECQDNNTFAQHWPSVPTQKKEDFILTYTRRRVHNTHERYDTSRQDIPSAPGLLPLSKITKTQRYEQKCLLRYRGFDQNVSVVENGADYFAQQTARIKTISEIQF